MATVKGRPERWVRAHVLTNHLQKATGQREQASMAPSVGEK